MHMHFESSSSLEVVISTCIKTSYFFSTDKVDGIMKNPEEKFSYFMKLHTSLKGSL